MSDSSFDDAAAYERFMGRWSRQLGPEFVRFVGIANPARVLDVGCGTGSLTRSFMAAGPPDAIVGIDPSPAFVAAARRNIPDPPASFDVGDAQALAFPDDGFDVAASMLALNFVPDSARAVGEMRRVTRPGGVVAACVWNYAAMPMLNQFWDAVATLDPAADSRHERTMPLCRIGELESLWRDTGLADVSQTSLAIDQRFSTFSDYWQPFLAGAGPAGAYVAALDASRRQALEARLRTVLWQDEAEAARTLSARAWAVRGIVPRS